MRIRTATGTLRALERLQKALRWHAPHVMVACMPKSASTFLTRVLAELFDCRIASLCYTYGRSEQELYLPNLLDIAGTATVTQQHLRATDANLALLRDYGFRTVVLVRNIFDAVVSIRDHQFRESTKSPMFYPPSGFLEFDDERQLDMIVDMALPWYFNFYASWVEASRSGQVTCMWQTYNDLIADKVGALAAISSFCGYDRDEAAIAAAIERVDAGRGTRLNKGVPGRGHAALSYRQRQRIVAMTRYYPGLDFSPLGIADADR